MKDLVLLAVSVYLLKQDVVRTSLHVDIAEMLPNRSRTDGMAAAVPTSAASSAST